MNGARFSIVKADEGRIDLRDHHTGLLFSFPIIDRKFALPMYTTVTGPGLSNKNPPNETIKTQARAFAEDEARKQGWI